MFYILYVTVHRYGQAMLPLGLCSICNMHIYIYIYIKWLRTVQVLTVTWVTPGASDQQEGRDLQHAV